MIGDIESVKQAIVGVLGTQQVPAIDRFGAGQTFNALLDAVNAEKADGYTTPYAAAVYGYERAVLEAYPAVEMQAIATTYSDEDDIKRAEHRIAVVWTVVGDNEETLTKDVERLLRATRDVFWRSVLSATLGLAPIHVESENYSALAPDPGGQPFMKGASVMLVVPALSE